jgi:hypothetical protein
MTPNSSTTDRLEPALLKLAGIVLVGAVAIQLDATIINVAIDTLGSTPPYPSTRDRAPAGPRPRVGRTRDADQQDKRGMARARIELATPRFSVVCSTN